MRIATGTITLNVERGGSGTPLVLTHGLGDNLQFWDAVAPALAERHQVIRWDVRGFGASDKPPGPYSAAGFAADLLALLDALELDRVHLAGISMGGVIAQRFALEHAERLRSLVLVSTSSEIAEKGAANWRRLADVIEQRGFGSGARDASRAFAPSFAARRPEIVAAAGEQTARNDPFAYATAARAMSDYHWTAELADVRVPALVLQGLADQLTPPGGSVKLSRALPAARLLMFEDTGHNLPLERPERFAAAVLGFTGGVDAAATLAADASAKG
jgi:pimeloyl-ACP methyl ester carboxylesterase